MSNTPHPENLISGYLDNQLSPSERAEVEKMLDADPELQVLFDELKEQSNSLSGLPKFRLGNDFADRLMASAEVSQAFTSFGEDSDTILKAKIPNSSRFLLSASAIAALAAMVLMTLWVPVPTSVTNVADLEDTVATEESADDDLFLSNAAEPSMVASKLEAVEGKTARPEQPDIVVSRAAAPGKSAFKADVSKRAEPKKFDRSRKAAGSASQRFAKSEGADSLDQPLGQVAEPAPVQTMQLAEFGVEADGDIAGSELADSKSKQFDRFPNAAAVMGDIQQQILTAQVGDGIDSIVEVEFESTGRTLASELQLALSRNSIAAEDLGVGNGDVEFENEAADVMAKGGGGGGFGGGGGIGGGAQQKLGQQANQNQSDTLAVLVNTTPQQMSLLVEDLTTQENAKVGMYELPQQQFFEQQAVKAIAEEIARSRDLAVESKQQAAQYFKSNGDGGRAEVEKLPGVALQSAKLQQKQRYRGFAQSLRKQSSSDFASRRGGMENQQRSKTRDATLSEEQKNVEQGLASDPVVDDAESMARYYLLLVRGSGSNTGASEPAEKQPSDTSRSNSSGQRQ